MSRSCLVTVFALLLLSVGCTPSPSDEPSPSPETEDINSLWTIDLVRTLPGQQAEYLRNIEANWAGARRIARERGAVVSYRALVAPPDSALGWDVMLLTEYADSAAWRDREAIFDSVFASPEYVRVPTARPSSELREFAAGSITMRTLVDQP